MFGVEGPFSGEVAEYYARFRRGYPGLIVKAIVERLTLTPEDVVVDLGCGTGLLALALASHVRVVVGMDPEPDMLAIARRCAATGGTANTTWLLGGDADVGVLRSLLGDREFGAVTVAQALHWMDHERLFTEIAPMIRSGGGVAVIANGTPLWQQDSGPSRALRHALEQWFDTTLTGSCGTDLESRSRYADALAAVGLEVAEVVTEYSQELDLEHVIGSMYSAMAPGDLPVGDRREAFKAHVSRALPSDEPFVETVRVAALIGAKP
jgi:ubiquinone/menaquinone biosynthesis C-methylase UbiE